MFIGTYEATIDAKGRVSVPARFREVIGDDGRLFMTASLDAQAACVVGYPSAEWSAFAERLSTASQADPSVIRVRRLVIAGAAECAIDRVGRVLLTPPLRERAQLEREVVWLGVGRTVELWDARRWRDEERRLRDGLAQDVASITNRGL